MGEAKDCKKVNKLSLLYINARSILNKLENIEALVFEKEPDIFAICESWTHSGVSDSEIMISNYNLIARADRTDTNNGRGGGLLIYSKKTLGDVIEINCDSS